MLSAIGDLHINALDRDIKGAYKKILSTYKKVVKNEIEHGATAIVQLGDCFDNADPYKTYVLAFIRTLYSLRNIPTHIIMGNHDFDDVNNHSLHAISYLFDTGFLNGKVYMKPEEVKISGDRYLFCPHPHIIDSPSKKVRLCFGHFGFEGARGDNGYVIKSGNAPKGRWVLGDYHTSQRGKSYIYPGSLTQVKFHENPNKYIVRIEDDIKTVKIVPDIKLGRTSISSVEDLQNLDKDTYWSVNISKNVKLPADWAIKYPNIVKHHAEKDTSKRQRVLMQQVASEDPLEGFGGYLLEQGLSRKEVKRTLFLLGIEQDV